MLFSPTFPSLTLYPFLSLFLFFLMSHFHCFLIFLTSSPLLVFVVVVIFPFFFLSFNYCSLMIFSFIKREKGGKKGVWKRWRKEGTERRRDGWREGMERGRREGGREGGTFVTDNHLLLLSYRVSDQKTTSGILIPCPLPSPLLLALSQSPPLSP